MTRSSVLGVGLLAVVLSLPAEAENWPRFRGPDGNGLTVGSNLPATWSAEANVAWKTSIPGRGWSSPVVWGDRVFVTTAVEEGDVYRWEVRCLDAGTGDVLWTKVAREGEPRIPTHGTNTYASETPCTDGERLYVYFGMHGVYCYDLDGNLLWERDLGAYEMINGWGTAASPVIHDGLLYIQVDSQEQSFLVALDAGSGEERWRANRDEFTSWSTPLVWTNSLRTEIVAGGQVITSYDPATGDVLWTLGMEGGRSSASPLAVGDTLYVGNEERNQAAAADFGGGVLRAVKAGGSGDITPPEGQTTSEFVLWSTPHCGMQISSPIVYGGWVYVFDRNGSQINCYNAETGEAAYEDVNVPGGKPFWSSPWAYDGKIFATDQGGTTHIIEPGATLNVTGTNVLGEVVWATPAIVDGALIIRGVENVYRIQP